MKKIFMLLGAIVLLITPCCFCSKNSLDPLIHLMYPRTLHNSLKWSKPATRAFLWQTTFQNMGFDVQKKMIGAIEYYFKVFGKNTTFPAKKNASLHGEHRYNLQVIYKEYKRIISGESSDE